MNQFKQMFFLAMVLCCTTNVFALDHDSDLANEEDFENTESIKKEDVSSGKEWRKYCDKVNFANHEGQLCCHYCRISINRQIKAAKERIHKKSKARKGKKYYKCIKKTCKMVYCRRCIDNKIDMKDQCFSKDGCIVCRTLKGKQHNAKKCCCNFAECTRDHEHCFTYKRTLKRHKDGNLKWTKSKEVYVEEIIPTASKDNRKASMCSHTNAQCKIEKKPRVKKEKASVDAYPSIKKEQSVKPADKKRAGDSLQPKKPNKRQKIDSFDKKAQIKNEQNAIKKEENIETDYPIKEEPRENTQNNIKREETIQTDCPISDEIFCKLEHSVDDDEPLLIMKEECDLVVKVKTEPTDISCPSSEQAFHENVETKLEHIAEDMHSDVPCAPPIQANDDTVVIKLEDLDPDDIVLGVISINASFEDIRSARQKSRLK